MSTYLNPTRRTLVTDRDAQQTVERDEYHILYRNIRLNLQSTGS
jgi:hypothetical protein